MRPHRGRTPGAAGPAWRPRRWRTSARPARSARRGPAAGGAPPPRTATVPGNPEALAAAVGAADPARAVPGDVVPGEAAAPVRRRRLRPPRLRPPRLRPP